jgi:hypothetical protein
MADYMDEMMVPALHASPEGSSCLSPSEAKGERAGEERGLRAPLDRLDHKN